MNTDIATLLERRDLEDEPLTHVVVTTYGLGTTTHHVEVFGAGKRVKHGFCVFCAPDQATALRVANALTDYINDRNEPDYIQAPGGAVTDL